MISGRYIVFQVDMISGRYIVCPYSKILSGKYDFWSLYCLSLF